eukprot:6483148-Amphidinium_carterae.1
MGLLLHSNLPNSFLLQLSCVSGSGRGIMWDVDTYDGNVSQQRALEAADTTKSVPNFQLCEKSAVHIVFCTQQTARKALRDFLAFELQPSR